jgi:hypothetical protein
MDFLTKEHKMADIIETFPDGTIVERDFTAEEKAQVLADKLFAEKQLQDKIDKEIAKEALLAKLGLTAEEAKLLLG